MKKLWLMVVATCAFSSSTFCAVNCEHVQDVASGEFAVLDEDGNDWEAFCGIENEMFNHHDLSSTKSKLCNKVNNDPIAKMVMEIFLESDYRKFVDHCAENLQSMTGPNQQMFKDVLILLAPGICSSEYANRIISLIGKDRNDVRAVGIQHLPFCLDMFFYGAVRNGQLGRYALAKMCIKAFYAPCLTRERDERFDSYDIYDTAFGGDTFENCDEIDYCAKRIWPNWK